MLKLILGHGLLAGAIVGLPLFGLTVALSGQPPLKYGVLLGYLTMLLALSLVFAAIKRRRDVDLGGVIRFWPAFGMGLAISVVAGLCYVLAWEAALAVTGMDFAADYAKAVLEQQRVRGASAEELARSAAEMARFREDYAKPLVRLGMSFAEIFPVGVLVSLVSAGLLRNSRFLPARRQAAAS